MVVLVLGVAVWRHRRTISRTRADERAKSTHTPARQLRLLGASQRLGRRLDAILSRSVNDASTWQQIEEALISADVGVRTSARVIERVRAHMAAPTGPAEIRGALRDEIAAMFPHAPEGAGAAGPCMVLVTGVNGVGKTTTVGKLAAAAVAQGRRVLLVAADTYRAAAIEQLEAWGRRLDVDVIRHQAGASPAAVAFDGATAGMARQADLVLFDTAGRLHTRTPLMDELAKVHRVVGQVCPGAPHEVLLVLDATTGQNALVQARAFREAVDVTGVVLTKLDGTAKGGVALAVASELGLPILYVGVGEGIDDLRPFDATEYAEALVGAPDA